MDAELSPHARRPPHGAPSPQAGREPSPIAPDDPAYAGQAVYTPATLRSYDTIVVRLSNTLVWRCPAGRIVDHYDRHVSSHHLDVGPGTAYYLDRCRWPVATPRITLLDANVGVLRYAARRLRRYAPELHAANVLEPIEIAPRSFGSVGLSYVLHCLPGGIADKAVVFDHLIPLVDTGGVIFGTTILGRGAAHTRVGRALLGVYNRKGIFSNLDDDRDDLVRALAQRFPRYRVDVVGAVARFAGWVDEA